MLSRVANSIYWLHRYIERAENNARFIDVNFNLALDLPPDLTEQWKPLLVALGDWELFQQLHDKYIKLPIFITDQVCTGDMAPDPFGWVQTYTGLEKTTAGQDQFFGNNFIL